LLALLLVVGTIIVYLPVWHAGLIWDDGTFVINNPLIRRADGLYRFWFSSQPVDYYPVTSSMLWVEWRFWGSNPLGYHVVNVLLHSLNAVLLWRVLSRLNLPSAWLAAALFAVHPVNVESVAWITERKNTLAMLFFLLSLTSYLRFEFAAYPEPKVTGPASGTRSATTRDQRRWYWLSFCAFALALLSKTTVAPLPLLLLGLAWWRRGHVRRADVARSMPFFLASITIGLISHWFEAHRAIGADFVSVGSFWTRLLGAGWAVEFYLYKAALPFDLRPIYPRWHMDSLKWTSYLPDLLVALGLLACVRYRKIMGKGPLASLVFFLVMLLPVLGFLNINFMMYSLVADRWQYFAIIGPLALAAAVIVPAHSWSNTKRLFAATSLASALLVVLGALSYRQCGIYADPFTFWQTALAGNPNSSVAHNNLGTVLLERGQLDEAMAHFQRVLQTEPNHAMAHYNLGGVLRQQGHIDEAIAQFQRALEIAPNHAKSHFNLGELQLQKGQLDEAMTHFQRACEIRPDYAEAQNAFGLALLQKGRVDAALTHLQSAVQAQPNLAEAHNNLARILSQKGRLDEAIVHLQKALEIQPEQAEAHNNLANVLRQKGRLSEAIDQYQKALAIRPDYAMAHYNLGQALQQLGQVSDAIAHYQRALAIRPDFAPAQRALSRATQ
jgi:tetratricopeptide (TPR) repeat protein